MQEIKTLSKAIIIILLQIFKPIEPKRTFYEDVYNVDGNIYKDQIDILIGGSPCQSFSIAGNGMSRNILDMIFTQIFTCYSKHIEKNINDML